MNTRNDKWCCWYHRGRADRNGQEWWDDASYIAYQSYDCADYQDPYDPDPEAHYQWDAFDAFMTHVGYYTRPVSHRSVEAFRALLDFVSRCDPDEIPF